MGWSILFVWLALSALIVKLSLPRYKRAAKYKKNIGWSEKEIRTDAFWTLIVTILVTLLVAMLIVTMPAVVAFLVVGFVGLYGLQRYINWFIRKHVIGE